MRSLSDIFDFFDASLWLYIVAALIGIPIEAYIVLNGLWNIWIVFGIIGFAGGCIFARKDLLFALIMGVYGLLLGTVLLFVLLGMIFNIIYEELPKDICRSLIRHFVLTEQKIGNMDAVHAVKVLDHADPTLRRSAVNRLASSSAFAWDLLGNAHAIEYLCRFLSSDNPVDQKITVIRFLGRIGDIHSEPCLSREYLQNTVNGSEYKREAGLALEQIGCPECYASLGRTIALSDLLAALQGQVTRYEESFERLSQTAREPIPEYRLIATREDEDRCRTGSKKFSLALDIAATGRKMANLGYSSEARTVMIKACGLASTITKFDYMMPTDNGGWKSFVTHPEKDLQWDKNDCLKKLDSINRYIKSFPVTG